MSERNQLSSRKRPPRKKKRVSTIKLVRPSPISPPSTDKLLRVRARSEPLIQSPLSISPVPPSPLYKSCSIRGFFHESNSLGQRYQAHIVDICRSLALIKQIPGIEDAQVLSKMRNLPRNKEDLFKKTLIFDLDETLIHQQAGSVKVRPYALQCLEEAHKDFEIFIFTASHRSYADAAIELLDPEDQFVKHKLYQEDCIPVEGAFVKDLRIINRNIQDIVIVDNSVWSFAAHVDNGIPILPWKGDPLDSELRSLIDYFPQLKAAEDVREVIRKTFQLNSLV